ncbi:uncharacterized protein LOC135829640 [Sycon ciliatum]|uniref:uncharacterized protein LOC135829640 n=1 Tax=Sycon ciliatum TaxID=27933 RepID=UPI0031F678A4
MESSGTFLLVLVMFAVNAQAQDMQVTPDPLVIVGGGSHELTCEDSSGNPSVQDVTWQFTFPVGAPSALSYQPRGQYNETMVLNINENLYTRFQTLEASFFLDCYVGSPPATFPTVYSSSIDLYNDVCQDPAYCATTTQYPQGSTNCTSNSSGGLVTFDCTCSPGDAGAPCRELRDCRERAATPADADRDCSPTFITVLRMTIPQNNIINGSTINVTCSSDIPFTARVNWTVIPAHAMEALSFSGPMGTTLTISPITADVARDTILRPVSVICRAGVTGRLGPGLGSATLPVWYDVCADADVCTRNFGIPPGTSDCVFPTTGRPRCVCRPGDASRVCRIVDGCVTTGANATGAVEVDILRCVNSMGCMHNNATGVVECSGSGSNAVVPSLIALLIVMVGMVIGGLHI